MRDHAFMPDQDLLGPGRLPVMRERHDATVVQAAMDLQRRAGNRSVAELVARSQAYPDRRPLALPSSAGRMPASAIDGNGGAAVSVQREPCVDCPEAAQRLAAEPETTTEPGQTG